MADEIEGLENVTVSGRDRNPGVMTRAAKSPMHLAAGTMFPRLQGILNPRLYRERGDTTRLVDRVFSEDGALSNLIASNPTLLTEIRNQAESPMTVGQHKQFRSAIMAMVGDEVERESTIQTQLADNAGYMEALAVLDSSIPGIDRGGDPTLEEKEREQIGVMFKQAQELALLDPAASKALMSEVRKRGDNLTSSIRTQLEQVRKAARIEDSSLAVNTRNASQTVNVALSDLRAAMAEGGEVPEHVLQKAMQAYGTAGQIAQTSVGDVLASTGIGAATGAAIGTVPGAVIGGVVAAAGGVKEYFKSKARIEALAANLENMQGQLASNYQSNRAALQERYKPLGIQFGEQPGEAYAVVSDAYQANADKIPKKVTTDAERASDQQATLRAVLADEVAASTAAEEQVRPEASANVPGAAERLASAVERAAIARDDMAIFEADQPGAVLAGDQAASVQSARKRREVRAEQRTRSQIRRGIQEALRGFTR